MRWNRHEVRSGWRARDGYGRPYGRMERKERKGRKEQDKNESFYPERCWVDFPKRKAHVGAAAAALGNKLAASCLGKEVVKDCMLKKCYATHD